MEVLKAVGWFIGGVLFASIGWGFVVLMLWNMYLSTESKYRDLQKKLLKEGRLR